MKVEKDSDKQDWVAVTVSVPGDRVSAFYGMFSRWLAGPDEPAGSPSHAAPAVETPATPISRKHWPKWSVDDVDEALAVYKLLSPKARAFFDLLLDNPAGVSGDRIAKRLKLSRGSRSVAGTLSWPGKFCHRFQRRLPIQWEADAEEYTVYALHEHAREVFRRARQDFFNK